MASAEPSRPAYGHVQKFNLEKWAQPLGDLNFQRAFNFEMIPGFKTPKLLFLLCEIIRADRKAADLRRLRRHGLLGGAVRRQARDGGAEER